MCFTCFFWLDADKLFIDIKIYFPSKKIDANIPSSNKLSKGKQPVKGECHDLYDGMCVML